MLKIKHKLFYYLLIILLINIFIIAGQTRVNSNNSCGSGTPRDKNTWPFSCDSIWNMPIGSQARYVNAKIKPAYAIAPEINFYITTTNKDPIVDWYSLQNWGEGRCELGGKLMGQIHFPHDVIVPDAIGKSTPNNAAAILQPDGRTLIQINPLARCEAGGPIFGYGTPNNSREDIYGQGITGGQGGSGLSSIGGTIRLGELLPSDSSIRHALKIIVWGKKYLYKEPPGYRWPALRADRNAFNPDNDNGYGGINPYFVMGSLLAIPPSVTEASLGLTTIPGKKIFHALQDYGGYIVEGGSWDAHKVAIEKGVEEEFKSTYGYDFYSTRNNETPFYEDMNKIFQALNIVINNSPDRIGGGGKPRKPLPAFLLVSLVFRHH